MISTSVILILSGVLCLLLSGYILYKVRPQEGQPPNAWNKTDFRATSFAMGQFILLIAGISFLVKGIF